MFLKSFHECSYVDMPLIIFRFQFLVTAKNVEMISVVFWQCRVNKGGRQGRLEYRRRHLNFQTLYMAPIPQITMLGVIPPTVFFVCIAVSVPTLAFNIEIGEKGVFQFGILNSAYRLNVLLSRLKIQMRHGHRT